MQASHKLSMQISIHALLAESDRKDLYTILSLKNFYPRSPCGERQVIGQMAIHAIHISIHALLAESDFGNIKGFAKSQ